MSIPATWTSQHSNCEVVSVSPASAEWSFVSSKFLASLPSCRIVHIGRVQNLVLWRRYQTQRRTMAYPNELFLFHGTGSLPPAIIYSGVEGFDPRCTGTGRFLGLGPYYGLGAYFAENAAYSDGGSPPFAYQTGTPGVRQMFLAQVLCGRVKDYGKELMRGLKRPPLVEGSHGLLYDSVQGGPHTSYGGGPSVMHVVYTTSHSYPSYIVTYEK